MASTMAKIDVHVIFHIKSTSVQMDKGDLPRIFEYIGGVLNGVGTIPIIIGGVSDHIHLLTSLPSTMSISELVRITKANSSKWIKTISPAYATFAWQSGYGAFSVSPSILNKTIEYIKNQEQHHQRTAFADELKAFLNAYQIAYNEEFIFND